MWVSLLLLAREPELESAALEGLLSKARKLGFATEELVYPQIQRVGN